MKKPLRGIAALLSLAMASMAVATICRNEAVEGFQGRMAAVSSWLGATTTDVNSIRLFISKGEHEGKGAYYIHSNFRSENPDVAGEHSPYATKIVEPYENIPDLITALGNAIFWVGEKGPPPSWREQAAKALSNAEIYVDPDLVAVDGRIPFDLASARSVMLARDAGPLQTGRLEPLLHRKPPPALIERIAGCCLSGRPAGRGAAIRRSLERLRFDPREVGLFTMVQDSATSERIGGSAVLRSAVERAGVASEGSWGDRLQTALNASRGRSLVVLSHVSKGEVVVEDLAGTALYRIAIDQLHTMAQDAQVNLVLLGCDTAAEAGSSSGVIGVVGRYNTVHAAQRLESALSGSETPLQFLEKLSDERLMIVTQEGAWSKNGMGATYYGQADGPVRRVTRLFRVWFLGERNG